MKRLSIMLSMIVVQAMLLTACGGEETSTTVPSTNVPPITVEVTATEPSVTEAPTTGTDTTTTPGVPVTGEESPWRVSNLLGYSVLNQSGEQVGQVKDLVLDLDTSRVSYVVVDTGGFMDLGEKTLLIPWDQLSLQAGTGTGMGTGTGNETATPSGAGMGSETATPSTGTGTDTGTATPNTGNGTGMGTNMGSQQNAFVLQADPEFLKNAPNADLSTMMPGMCQAATNWDTDIRNFWATGAMPAGTQPASTPAAGTGNETATPSTMSTATATTNSGTGPRLGQGQASQLQGVVLASDVIGATLTIGNGNGAGGPGTGTGTGKGAATAVPSGTANPDTTATAVTGTVNNGSAATTQATVEDLIVDPATGDIQYVVINSAGTQGEHWIPVPLNFLRCDAANNSFMVNVDANALQNAPFFAPDQFPDTSTNGWDTEFNTWWQSHGGAGTGPGIVTAATATP